MDTGLDAETKYRLLERIFFGIRDTLDLDAILNQLLDLVQSVIAYDAAGIFVLTEDFFRPRGRQSRELIGGIATRGFDLLPARIDPMLTEAKGIVGHVIRTGESVVASDVRSDPRYVAGRTGTLSEVAVPIVREGRPIGALNLESNRSGAYRQSDLEVLRFFSEAAAISIEKVMLHRQILENERIEEQLKLAHHVQSRLLPDDPPEMPGYDIAGTSIPTPDEIGGDYFDYLWLPDGKIGIVVADISGHGIPAALMMTEFRALLRTHAQRESRPFHIAKSLSRTLPEFMGEEHYVTSVYGVLDPSNGRFAYVNCGHPTPMVFRADGSVEELLLGGPVLSCALGDASYNDSETRLAPGDLLLLYTDGVVDVESAGGEEFGKERLKRAVRRSLDLSASEIIRELVQATREFSGSEDYRDDFTVVTVRRV